MKLLSAVALKEAMTRKGLSLADLARAAGVSKGFVSHLTSGRKTTMRPIVGYRIAERLDVPVSMLFEVHAPSAQAEASKSRPAAA